MWEARKDDGPRMQGENQVSGVLEAFQGLVTQFGLPGVFVISVLGSVVPFVPLPYLLVIVLLSGTQNPLLLGLAAGAGGAIGKLTSYFLGRFGYAAAGKETRGSLDTLHSILAKYGALGVFIFAVSPLPDDVYVIPMGIIRLPFWKFFAADLAGKVVLSVGVAYLGRAYFASASSLLGDSLAVTAGAAVATVVVSALVMRADWALAVDIARRDGMKGLAANFWAILRLRRRGKN